MEFPAIAGFFRWLNEAYGIDFTVFHDPYAASMYGRAILLTIELTVLSLTFSTSIGVLGAVLRFGGGTITRAFVDSYVALFRNTPLLAQLYFLYFGLGTSLATSGVLPVEWQGYFSGFFWSVVALSIHFGAYNIEAIRAGLEAVPKTTIEAAQALGYSSVQTMRSIVLPIGLRIALPALSNCFVQIVKSTAIAYAVAVPEVLYVADRIWSDNFNVPEMMNVVLVTYLAIVGLVVAVTAWADRMLRMPGMQVGA